MEFPELPPLRPAAPPQPQPAAPIVAAAIVSAATPEPSFPSVSPANEKSFQAFETLVGGRAALVGKLALVVNGKQEDQVVGLLADPRNDKIPLAAICRKGRIALRQLMELYRDASLVASQVQSIEKVAAALPGVAADVMNRAITHRITCATCQGTTKIAPAEPTKDNPNPAPRDCPDCNGYGDHIREPEHEVQKTALALGGLLRGKEGGVQVSVTQNNQQITGLGAAGGFDDLVEKLDTVLFGTARDRVAKHAHTVVEGDILPPAQDPEPTESGDQP